MLTINKLLKKKCVIRFVELILNEADELDRIEKTFNIFQDEIRLQKARQKLCER